MSHPIGSFQDIPRALEAAFPRNGLLLEEADLGATFFDLRSGLAGELFQKFVNYRMPLAIVLSSAGAHGERFDELVHEHWAHPVVRFFSSAEEAAAWLKSAA